MTLHHTGMIDCVRGAAFAQEARANLRVTAQLGVEDLHCDAGSVAVGRRVDSGHATDAEKDIESPLFLEHLADASARPNNDGVKNVRGLVVLLG